MDSGSAPKGAHPGMTGHDGDWMTGSNPGEKSTLRTAALAWRDAISDENRAAAAQAIAARGLPVEIKPGAVVAGYSPIRNEIDPFPLMQTLAAKGARLALPVVPARGKSLIFRAWTPRDRLMLGPLG